MATVARLKTLASVTSLVSVFAVLCGSSALRSTLERLFSPTTHPIRFAALITAVLLNGKSLPLVWHLRFFKVMIQQLYVQRREIPRDALFRPIICSNNYTPIPEMDYNGHKSNSTYFADFDMARTELVTCLLRKGIRNAGARKHPELPLGKDGTYQPDVIAPNGTANGHAERNKGRGQDVKPQKAVFAIALGAVSCHFKREVKPYQKYEIWTRILSWDRKWVYIVSHLVAPGAVPPENNALQPWKRVPSRSSPAVTKSDVERREQWKNAIFATSLSKYVVKRGRQTVPPELVLKSSDLLPPAPGEQESGNSGRPFFGKTAKEDWTWEFVEQERQRGLRLAEHFGALDGGDGLHDEFPVYGGKSNTSVEVLGNFDDLLV